LRRIGRPGGPPHWISRQATKKRWPAPQSSIAATNVGRAGTYGPLVNWTGRADARLMTPEGVIAGQKARPHVRAGRGARHHPPTLAAAARGNLLEQRRNVATVIL
jgi:hypothetical protein